MCETRDWLTLGREPGWLGWVEGKHKSFMLLEF